MIKTINDAISKRRDALEDGENEKGFTLIELMVVIIIIGILAAIAIPAFLNQRQSAWDASVKSDLANAAIAAASYAQANSGSYLGMTVQKLKDSYSFADTPDNTLVDGTASTAGNYQFKDSNKNNTSRIFTLNTGTIVSPS